MSSRDAKRKSTRGEYIETDTGNKISRRAQIAGTPNIILGGRVAVKAGACLRGDLGRPANASADASAQGKEASRTAISVGRYTLISNDATLHPPHRVLRGGEMAYYPMKIGENVFVGEKAFIAAASIGSFVHLGKGCVVENGVIVRDCVKVLEGSILPAGMVVPSFVVVGGRPARILGDVPDGWGVQGEGTMEEWVEGGELRELIRSIK